MQTLLLQDLCKTTQIIFLEPKSEKQFALRFVQLKNFLDTLSYILNTLRKAGISSLLAKGSLATM
jgi:hypothetical protein